MELLKKPKPQKDRILKYDPPALHLLTFRCCNALPTTLRFTCNCRGSVPGMAQAVRGLQASACVQAHASVTPLKTYGVVIRHFY